MEYIPAEKLIAEIKKQKKHLSESKLDERGAIIAYDIVLRFIHTLKQEQPEVDLEKAARNVYKSLNDVHRDMVELGRVLNTRKEE